MKWEMNEKSLFAVLLRSPWWVSGAIAVATIVLLLGYFVLVRSRI